MTDIQCASFGVTPGGFVKLFRCDGTDDHIRQIASISYDHDHDDLDPNNLYGFIHMLLSRGHMGPFEMCHITFEVKVPMDTWRQWIRHRTASVNEYSTRYNKIDISNPLEQLCNVPVLTSDSKYETCAEMNKNIENILLEAFDYYAYLLRTGVKPEVARSILPLCTYTRAYWQIDLRNLMNFLRLRLDNHAQGGVGGIREYAIAVDQIFKVCFPVTHRAWHSLNGDLTEGVYEE